MKKPPTMTQMEQDMKALGIRQAHPDTKRRRILRILLELCEKHGRAVACLEIEREAGPTGGKSVSTVLSQFARSGDVHRVGHGYYLPANVEKLRKKLGGAQ